MTSLEFDELLGQRIEDSEFRREWEALNKVLCQAPLFVTVNLAQAKGSIPDTASAISDTALGFLLGRVYERQQRAISELEKMVS